MKNASTHIVPTINHEASGPSYSVTRLCQALLAMGQPTKLAVLEPLPAESDHGFVTAFPYGVGPRWLQRYLQDGEFSGNRIAGLVVNEWI